MKKLALLSVAALMLASSVFAPVAQAQEPGDVEIQSLTLEPNGPWTATGTIQCVEGERYQIDVAVTQNIKPHEKKFKFKDKKKSDHGITTAFDMANCTITGPQSFTLFLIPLTVTEKDKLWLVAQGEVLGVRQSELIIERIQ